MTPTSSRRSIGRLSRKVGARTSSLRPWLTPPSSRNPQDTSLTRYQYLALLV
jgi:hypothetical protein